MIPFNKPYVPEASKKYAMEVLESDHQQGDGPFTARASKMVSDLVGGGHVLLTPSCTHALEMASMLGNFGPGDEVILPSYTFTSAATAVTKFGARPVFVDIDPVTKGIDANQVAGAVTDKTVAISWVNYAGVAPDIEALQAISKTHDLLLIEDNAHGLGGTYNGKPLGSFGDFATQSFHATKNIQCGEGGALVINNQNFTERAEIIREKGTDRKSFIQGNVNKYQWIDKGSSYLLSEVQAAILQGQLENFEFIQKERLRACVNYSESLKNSPLTRNVKLNQYSESAHIFYVENASSISRESAFSSLRNLEVNCTSHYEPLHSSIGGRLHGSTPNEIVNAKTFSQNIMRLPLWVGITDYIPEVIKALEKAFE